MTHAVSEPAGADEAPTVDIVVPVFNEGHVLARSVTSLHRYLSQTFPFPWRITIVDNASTDETAAVGAGLADQLPRVRFVHLDRKGRGLALRVAWAETDAPVVAYMDVDLSTGLEALLPLVAPLVSGHSDVAIGSRLAPGSNVARGPKREAISRAYNLILRVLFSASFRDAQCGFKAARTDVVRRLLPEITDDGWFFDTELLLLAEHNGLRIHEVPVDWVDDPDTRVRILATARGDLLGTARMARRFATGAGVVELGPSRRSPLADDLGRRLVSFALVGLVSTAVSLALFLGLRDAIGSVAAVVSALAATAVANSWAHRRFSFRRRGREGLLRYALVSGAVILAGMVASASLVGLVDAHGGGLAAEVLAMGGVAAVVTVARFGLLQDRNGAPSPSPSPSASR